MPDRKLGIDFGTSFSTMCALDRNGQPKVLRDESGNEKIPSIVYWGADGVKVGQAALDILLDLSTMDEEARLEAEVRLFRSVKPGFP